MNDYHVQFCDREVNQDITGSPTAEQDATEIRLWDSDECIVAVEKNARSGMWHVSASDCYNWTHKARKAWRDWRDAMISLHREVAIQLKQAGY